MGPGLCAGDLCLRVEEVEFEEPPAKIEVRGDGAVAVCVAPEAVGHWLALAQAMYYAYHWKGPARNPNISALMFLTQSTQIKDALGASAAGRKKAICAVLAPRDALDKVEVPRGRPTLPQGTWDPWKITKYALDLIE